MRAYQLRKLINGVYEKVSLPFDDFEQAKRLMVKLATTPTELDKFKVEEVTVNVGELFRNYNVIYERDNVIDGISRGVYFDTNPEHI